MPDDSKDAMMNNKRIRILVVDDEPGIRFALSELLNDEGYEVAAAGSAEEASSLLNKESFDIALIDYQLKGMNGLELLLKIKKEFKNIYVIIITAFGSEEVAIASIKKGAYDYIAKPFRNEELLNRVNHIKELIYKSEEIRDGGAGWYFSQTMLSIIEKVKTIAVTDVPLFITGESGVGKELIARICHNHSGRNGSFVSINCSALPDSLIESELFGAEKGSFTGSLRTKIGLFEQADKGTIFLDEIGDMPLELQVKILRTLEESEILRIGNTLPIKIDSRIIAATNKNIEDEVRKKYFREDLYYRLSVIRIEIPPLRKRKDEIKPLSEMFLAKFKKKYDKEITGFTDESNNFLLEHEWPGNIRELKNTIEQAVILSKSGLISFQKVSPSLQEESKNADYHDINNNYSFEKLPANLMNAKKIISSKFEKEFIEYHLNKNNWNISKTASLIGLYRQDLYKKIKTFNIKKR